MVLPRTLLVGATALAVAVMLCLPPHRAAGDLLIFKDGFAINGRVRQETTLFTDPASGQPFKVPAGKPHWLDDGVRNIFFSPFQLQEAVPEPAKSPDFIRLIKPGPGSKGGALPKSWEITKTGAWDERWERTVSLSFGKNQRMDITQRITAITPETIRVESKSVNWTTCYKTSEFTPAMLRSLIFLHTDVKKEKDIDQRLAVYRFFLQAGMPDAARQELELLRDNYPDQKSTVDPLLDGIKRLQAGLFYDALLRAEKAGMHREIAERIAYYDKHNLDKLLDEKLQLKVQGIREKHETLRTKTQEAKRLLVAFGGIGSPVKKEFFQEAMKVILDDVNPDTVGRLETFLGQAQDYERAFKDNRKSEQTADEVMAFAISGWLRGSDVAERDVGVAIRQWECRQILIDYFKSDDYTIRKGRLIPLLKSKGLTVDEAMQILKLLPPADAPQTIDAKPQMLTTRNDGSTYNYHVALPPGYHAQRTWPVLMVLHHSEEKASEALARWQALAAYFGYIVVAPEWGRGLRVTYGYTAKEHRAVLESLRDARRRFQVDSDRVFLFGGEQGANMAFDVGTSHPDQFAGIIPMSGSPQYFVHRYWPNAQYLPFYIVNGEKTGAAAEYTKALLKDWIQNNFPCIYAEYKGRTAEWFAAEQAIIFDWMNRKKRANPLKELGGRAGEEYKTHRSSDNQFYWLGVDHVQPGRINDVANWSKTAQAATVAASVYSNNMLDIKTNGVGTVTVWFGPKLVEYKDKVTIRLNGSNVVRTVTPNLETLLETLYATGDRQRMYFARVDLKV